MEDNKSSYDHKLAEVVTESEPDHGPGLLAAEPNLGSAMRLYLFVFIMLLVLGSILQALHFEAGMFLTQWGIILPPAFWYWRRYNVNRASFARLHPLRLRFLPAVIILAASFWLLNMVIAAGLMLGLMELGYQPLESIPPPDSLGQYIIYILLIAVSAGICEEMLFRGTILPSMEGEGIIPAIVFSSFLFALYHISFTNLISTFMLGVVIAVVVIKTGSLWGGVVYHMLNNFIAVTYLYAAGAIEETAELETVEYWPLLLLLVPALIGAYAGLRMLHRQSACKPLLEGVKRWLPKNWFGWPLLIGIILFLLMAMLELAIGFGWFDIL
ncbi:MAG: type II CAAX endopeptidase family protein [Bacillota bacterium]|nr:type II CAAX endopeptidase family protein [Bacillota bacterium]